jgi:hypothetical protein
VSAATWHGGYHSNGRFTSAPPFACEADAIAWAEETSRAVPWVIVGIGEDVRQVGGGNYARPKKCHEFKAGVRLATYHASATCG